MDFIARFKEKLASISDNLNKSKFDACSNISTDLIRTSEFVGFPEGVFVGEFFESLLSNLGDVNKTFKIEQVELGLIKKEIDNLIHLFERWLPTDNPEAKVDLYDTMVRTRSLVTELQVKNYREGARTRRIKESPTPTITFAEE